MLRLFRFLWTGDWRLPEWVTIKEVNLYDRDNDKIPVGTKFIVRDKVSGRIRSFKC